MDDGVKLHKVEVRATVWVMATDREDAKGITMDWLNEDAIPLELTACLALANQQHEIARALTL